MKDIIEKILAYLPQYFAELGQVCATPKRFIAERDVFGSCRYCDGRHIGCSGDIRRMVDCGR